MAWRAWSIQKIAPKCDACGCDGPAVDDEHRHGKSGPDYPLLRNVAQNADWWVRHHAMDDMFMLCPTCRRTIGKGAK